MSNAMLMTGVGGFATDTYANGGIQLLHPNNMGGLNNVWSPFSEIISSTTVDAHAINCHFFQGENASDGMNAGPHNFAFELAIGASGFERVIVPEVVIALGSLSSTPIMFPVRVPRGTRIAARWRYWSSNSNNFRNALVLTLQAGGGLFPVSAPALKSYGAVMTDEAWTGGTAVDPGTSANTLGAWTQIAELGEPSRAIMAMMCNATAGNTINAFQGVEIGVWNGSSYTRWFGWTSRRTSNGTVMAPTSLWSWRHLPAGTVIGARALCNSTAAPRVVGVSILSVP